MRLLQIPNQLKLMRLLQIPNQLQLMRLLQIPRKAKGLLYRLKQKLNK